MVFGAKYGKERQVLRWLWDLSATNRRASQWKGGVKILTLCVHAFVVVVGSSPAIGLPSYCDAKWCWKSSPLIKLQYWGSPSWLSSLSPST